ncbi:conserved unknown protein [Ectocarpus siliculosus]|uniref:EGF-like domain-containing protein n=1 Tax=Ectocarpus siliculosus TaxID=2880 RepID=D7G1P0_ECTSI|nr:conserved unknown protein [Ectocarpus siliculosus]|eukprot:CBJ33285.1 conserved unknown protein [Ectocarpus siliculosus]
MLRLLTCAAFCGCTREYQYSASGTSVGASLLRPDDAGQSVCFNNCSGRGRCIDYTCECDAGYDGDDCSFCYLDGGDTVLPILSVGDVNLTSSNFRETLHNAGRLLVVATSPSCHRCIHLETEYQSASVELKEKGVIIGRIDADAERALLGRILGGVEAAAQHLPAILLWTETRKSRKALLYDGAHERHSIVEYVRKQLEPPAKRLTTITAVENFIKDPQFGALGTAPSEAVTVVGFFSGAGEMEEDELEDFMEAATDLKPRPGLSRAPSLTLWAILEDNLSFQDWVVRESLPLVGRLSNANFAQYERTHLPMLIMFLELPDSFAAGSAHGSRIGGKSGGVRNDELVKELKEVALEHKGSITCLYADGVALADSMKTLGLFGSRERLPQVGFNTMDGRQLPFPEDLPINRETLLHFAAAFLSGRLQSALDARKAMVVSRPFSAHNTVRRKDRRETPTEVRGVSEQLKPKDAITQVTRESFARTVLDNDKDVLLMFHAERVGERFLDLDIPSVLIAAMDVTLETPPPEVAMTLPTLPAIVLLPGDDKEAPFRFFSGVGKVGPLMRWLQEHSSTPFELPALPHLSEEDKPLFRKQVRERQELLNARASQES